MRIHEVVYCGRGSKRYGSEQGVFAPLAAVIASAVVFIIIVFLADVFATKVSKSLLVTRLDEICSNVSTNLPFQAMVVDETASIFNNMGTRLNGLTDITNLAIIIPTTDGDPTASNPMEAGDPVSVSDYGFSGPCPNCLLFGGDTNGMLTRRVFPTGFWSNARFGDYVSCVARARVRTIFMGQRTILAKTAYKYRVRDLTPRGPPPALSPSGVLIGLAAEADIDSNPANPNLTRFVFQDPYFSPPNNNFNPLFYHDSVNTPPGINNIQSFGYNRPTRNFMGNVFTGTNAMTPPQRREMLIHCYNPMVAARNVILESILERLARKGVTNQNTQFVFVPPYHRDGNAGPNLPILMIEDGQSLTAPTAPSFQLPIVNYRSDRGKAATTNYLCPFTTCNPLGVDQIRDHMAAFNQIRDCFSVNYALPAGTGISTMKDLSLTNVSTGTKFFEPPQFISRDQLDPFYGPGLPEPWDQRANENITAVEIARVFPVVEHCPSPSVGSCARPDLEIIPDNFPNGLKGDIRAFLQYANGGTARRSPGFVDVPNGPPLPLDQDVNGAPVANPDTAMAVLLFMHKRINPFNPMNTATPPAAALEAAAIRSQIDTLNGNGQRAIVVFIPTNCADVQPKIVANLLVTFNASLPGGFTMPALVNPPNRLFILNGPLSTFSGADYFAQASTLCPPDTLIAANAATEDAYFSQYWESLLLPGPANAWEIADSIYKDLFVRELAL